MRDARGRRAAKVFLAVATAMTLGGCFHIPARALANGRELGYSTTSQVMYGQHNPAAQRQLYQSLQSSAFGHRVDYRPFPGQWSR